MIDNKKKSDVIGVTVWSIKCHCHLGFVVKPLYILALMKINGKNEKWGHLALWESNMTIQVFWDNNRMCIKILNCI